MLIHPTAKAVGTLDAIFMELSDVKAKFTNIQITTKLRDRLRRTKYKYGLKSYDFLIEELLKGFELTCQVRAIELQETIMIDTREGTLKGYKGDFLIEGVNNEIYPCGREIFWKTYEEVH